MNIEDNIPRYLQAELKFLTTQCVIIETEKLGSKVAGALIILKKFPLHKCGHEGKPVPGSKCITSMVGKTNKNHYIIATQDRDLQDKFRKIPAAPLLYLHQKTPVFEQPSEESVKAATEYMNSRFGVGESEKSLIKDLRDKQGIADEEKPKKKKKIKGPNPLSCKKKKKKPVVEGGIAKKDTNNQNQKKHRKRVRVAKHVKELLLNSVSK